MPLPVPNSNENKNEFVSRCVSKLNDDKEFKSQDQRLAVCYSQWEEKKENMKKTEKNNIIEVQKEVKIGKIILEKGDKIEILEQKDCIEESHWIDLAPKFLQMVNSAYNKGGKDYVEDELQALFDYMRTKTSLIDQRLSAFFEQAWNSITV